MPGSDSTLRRALNQWFDSLGIRPQIRAELDDAALAKILGEAGLGVFAAPDVVEQEILQRDQLHLVGRTNEISLAELPPHLVPAKDRPGVQIPGATLDDIERYAITKTLEATGGSTSRAAEILGISIRKIQYKLHEYNSAPKSAERALREDA